MFPSEQDLGLDDDEQEQLEIPELTAEEEAAIEQDLEIAPARVKEEEAAPEQEQPDLGLDDDGQSSLEIAESIVARARQVSDELFRQARRWPEYKRVLATRERHEQFEKKLLDTARLIDARFGKDTMLPPDALQKVVTRLANRIAAWDHSPERQKERQRKQAAARRQSNRGRDLGIVRAAENGESQRSIAARLGISRSAVRNVLKRDRRDEKPGWVGHLP